MSTAAHLGVSGAPVRAVAELLAAATDTTAAHQGANARGDQWSVASGEWSVELTAYTPEWHVPGDADVIVDVYYPGESVAPLHQLTERLYRRIVDATTWDVSAESEVDGFPARSRIRAAA